MTETVPTEAEYGCHCDLEPGMVPDHCVLDLDRPTFCDIALRLHADGKDKWSCPQWRAVKPSDTVDPVVRTTNCR